MKTITITLNGKKYKASLNLASRIEIKKFFKKNMEEIDFENDEENIYKSIYCMLKANNDNFTMSYKIFIRSSPVTIIAVFGELVSSSAEELTAEVNEVEGNATAGNR